MLYDDIEISTLEAKYRVQLQLLLRLTSHIPCFIRQDKGILRKYIKFVLITT
jgi:hypothetical protein